MTGTGTAPKKEQKENGKEFAVQTPIESVQVFVDPHNAGLSIIHAYVPIRNFPNGQVPDDVNPRSHDKLPTRLAQTIEESLKESPTYFHLLNRGLLVLAEKAGYDEKTQTLTFSVSAKEINGMADGATTDRVLAKIKREIPEFDKLRTESLPEHLRDSVVHVEIIAGDINGMLVDLASARNTSLQVKEFALENLGGGFDWLKESLGKTEFADKIRYRENDPQIVDVRTILGLLTMFHPKWGEEKREPVLAYTNKGQVLDYYRDAEWQPGYVSLRNVAPDILRLYDYIHVSFQKVYDAYKSSFGEKGKLGARKEVRFKEKGMYTLPLTGGKTQYLIPDGWLYPILAAFRMLLVFPPEKPAMWHANPTTIFDAIGPSMVADVVEASDAMGRNAAAVGRARPLWNALRKSIVLKDRDLHETGHEVGPATDLDTPTAGKVRGDAQPTAEEPRKSRKRTPKGGVQ